MPSWIFHQAGQNIGSSTVPTSLFNGEFLNMHGESVVRETFKDISVPISKSVTTLDGALADFFCDSANVSISKFPDILVVDLKRFYYDVERNSVEKVSYFFSCA
jgi:hypothetical protein